MLECFFFRGSTENNRLFRSSANNLNHIKLYLMSLEEHFKVQTSKEGMGGSNGENTVPNRHNNVLELAMFYIYCIRNNNARAR